MVYKINPTDIWRTIQRERVWIILLLCFVLLSSVLLMATNNRESAITLVTASVIGVLSFLYNDQDLWTTIRVDDLIRHNPISVNGTRVNSLRDIIQTVDNGVTELFISEDGPSIKQLVGHFKDMMGLSSLDADSSRIRVEVMESNKLIHVHHQAIQKQIIKESSYQIQIDNIFKIASVAVAFMTQNEQVIEILKAVCENLKISIIAKKKVNELTLNQKVDIINSTPNTISAILVQFTTSHSVKMGDIFSSDKHETTVDVVVVSSDLFKDKKEVFESKEILDRLTIIVDHIQRIDNDIKLLDDELKENERLLMRSKEPAVRHDNIMIREKLKAARIRRDVIKFSLFDGVRAQ